MARWNYSSITRTKFFFRAIIHYNFDTSRYHILCMRCFAAIGLTIGLTHFSQLHPGSSVILPIVVPFVKVVNSSLPLSNVLTSSGEFIDFFSIGAALAADVDILFFIISWG